MHERPLEQQIERYPHWNIERWKPRFPPGRLERIYTHWSAHDYSSVFPAYHYCVAVAGSGELVVVQTNDLTTNMRDVRAAPEEPYAAHTRGRNSFAAGISIMGMHNANPHDFGPFPLTGPLIEALCLTAAQLASHYAIPIDADHIMSHAEAALIDGYFGTGPEERWDIARLQPKPEPLIANEAVTTGDELRARMRAALKLL